MTDEQTAEWKPLDLDDALQGRASGLATTLRAQHLRPDGALGGQLGAITSSDLDEWEAEAVRRLLANGAPRDPDGGYRVRVAVRTATGARVGLTHAFPRGVVDALAEQPAASSAAAPSSPAAPDLAAVVAETVRAVLGGGVASPGAVLPSADPLSLALRLQEMQDRARREARDEVRALAPPVAPGVAPELVALQVQLAELRAGKAPGLLDQLAPLAPHLAPLVDRIAAAFERTAKAREAEADARVAEAAARAAAAGHPLPMLSGADAEAVDKAAE